MKKYVAITLAVALAAVGAFAVATRKSAPEDLTPYKYHPVVNHKDAAALVERITNACNIHREGRKVWHGHTIDWATGDEINTLAKGTVKVTCEENHAENDYSYKTWITAVAQ